ncbi:hypothetical protein DF186_21560, partial [Enterococcus hirae]
RRWPAERPAISDRLVLLQFGEFLLAQAQPVAVDGGVVGAEVVARLQRHRRQAVEAQRTVGRGDAADAGVVHPGQHAALMHVL